MSEDEARAWIAERVPRGTFGRLEALAAVVTAEAQNQNLIAASTLSTIWSRHIVDSAQLLEFAPPEGRWIDLGPGAGFPGLVIAIMAEREIILAESRTRRIAFLTDAIEALGLTSTARVHAGRIEMMPPDPFAVISARAFAPLDRLFATASHLSSHNTRWVLPKGRGAQAELDAARGSWQGVFRVEPSATDPDAAIIVADHVRPTRGGRNAGSTR